MLDTFRHYRTLYEKVVSDTILLFWRALSATDIYMARRVLPSCLAACSTSIARPDRRVYLHFDGYGRGASWPIADYGEQGIFTTEQRRLLGSRFDLSQTLTSELSLYIGNTLDIESVMNLTSVSRDKAVKTAEEALRRAVRHARQEARRQSNLVDVLLECSSLFADDPADAALLDHCPSSGILGQKAA